MMKKYIYILLFITWGMSSCEDYLEVDPKNLTAIKTYKDVKVLMGACLSEYTQGSNINNVEPLFSNPNFYKAFVFYSGQLDDENYLNNWWGRNNRGLFYQSLQWYYEPLHSGLWNNLYSSIGFYNTVIDELGKINGVSEDEANIILGEARFLRAWNLFKLMQYFSPYHDNRLGIPVNLNAEDVLSYDSKRRTQTEVYEIILHELNEILSYATKPTSYNLFYDKQLTHALLAQVYLFKGGSGAGVDTDYDKAAEHAEKAMEGKQLLSLSEFNNMFEVKERGVDKEHKNALLVCTKFSASFELRDVACGYAAYGMPNLASEKCMQLFSEHDVRNTWVDKQTGAIGKFKELALEYDSYFFFRIADLQLIVAEAYARKGDNTKAIVALEKLQENRIEGYPGYTGNNVLQEILTERKREFCFEFDMIWLDMVRSGEGFSRPAIDNPELDAYILATDDYRFTQPIPSNSELENNKIEQNPDWNLH